MTEIDYGKLARGVIHYKTWGYDPVAVPWIVSEVADSSTKPPNGTSLEVRSSRTLNVGEPHAGFLVASGEQSFVELLRRGTLSPGKYQCVTPCFRVEPAYSDTSLPYFMKLELIDTENPNSAGLVKMKEAVYDFYSRFIPCRFVQLGESLFDLESIHGVELGSYGIRTFGAFSWVYGTGCAEPRLTSQVNR